MHSTPRCWKLNQHWWYMQSFFIGECEHQSQLEQVQMDARVSNQASLESGAHKSQQTFWSISHAECLCGVIYSPSPLQDMLYIFQLQQIDSSCSRVSKHGKTAWELMWLIVMHWFHELFGEFNFSISTSRNERREIWISEKLFNFKFLSISENFWCWKIMQANSQSEFRMHARIMCSIIDHNHWWMSSKLNNN